MTEKKLSAAAVPEGTIVRMLGLVADQLVTFEIQEVRNSTPEPGKITWVAMDGMEITINASRVVEVLSFP